MQKCVESNSEQLWFFFFFCPSPFLQSHIQTFGSENFDMYARARTENTFYRISLLSESKNFYAQSLHPSAFLL